MKLISVTSALSPFVRFDGVPAETLRLAAERGQRIHAAAAAKLTGTFLVSPLPPEEAGYWESLSDWIDSMVEHVYDVEPELVDERLGFVGHPDLICKVNGRHYVVDWKTPQTPSPTWKIQLAAYCHLADANYRRHAHTWHGMTVQPDREGKLAKGTPYPRNPADWAVFISCLNAYRFFHS